MAFAAYRDQVNAQFIQSCFLCPRPNLSNFDFSLHRCNQGECSKPGMVWFLYAYSLHLILIPPLPEGNACVFIFGEKPRHREFTVLFYSTSCLRGWASTTADSKSIVSDHRCCCCFRMYSGASQLLPLHLIFNFREAVYRAAHLQVILYAMHTQCCTTLCCSTGVTPRVLGRLGKRSSTGLHSMPVPRQNVLFLDLLSHAHVKFISFDGFLPISSSFLCSKSRFIWSFGNSGKTAVKGHR